MTHLPRRGLSMTKIIDRINKQSDGIVAQGGILDDHDKAISDLWDECARIEQATASRVNNRHTETTADLLARVRDLDHECPAIAAVHDLQQRVTHLEEEQVSDLLARVRDLELVVATEARPRELTPVVATEARPRELTPEEAERDTRLRIMLDDIRRESQRRQQAAQESQEQAPAPGLAPEDTGTATPRLTQRQRLVRADWALVWAQRHEGDRRRHDVVVALDWLREWADEAGIDTPDLQFAPDPDPDWHLRTARVLIREELEDSPRFSAVPVAIAHLKALLTTLGLLTVEPERTLGTVEPEQATPDPEELLTLALEQVNCARDGDACALRRDCLLRYELDMDHCDREHVSQALGYLRQWQDVADGRWTELVLLVGEKSQPPAQQLSAAAWAIEYGLRWAHERETWVALARARLERWQEQQPDDDVISAEILHAGAAAEMPTLPPDPTPTQRAGQVIHHLGLAMMGQDPGPLHWVEEARRSLQRLDLPLPMHWEDDDALLGRTAEHLLGGSHESAIACLDEWLRREAQA